MTERSSHPCERCKFGGLADLAEYARSKSLDLLCARHAKMALRLASCDCDAQSEAECLAHGDAGIVPVSGA